MGQFIPFTQLDEDPAFLSVTDSAQAIVTAAAGKLTKVASLVVANTTGTARTLTIEHYRNPDTTTYAVLEVPANSLNVIWDTGYPLPLAPGDELRLTADAAGALEATAALKVSTPTS